MLTSNKTWLRPNLNSTDIKGCQTDEMSSEPSAVTDTFALLAQLVLQVRAALRALSPFAFSENSTALKTRIAALTAMVRRYLHALAAEVSLPMRRAVPRRDKEKPGASSRGTGERGLPLFENDRPATGRAMRRSQGTSHPYFEWGQAFMQIERLARALAQADRRARRLAGLLRRRSKPLRSLPLRVHHLRRLPPELDTLLLELDRRARPELWRSLNLDTT